MALYISEGHLDNSELKAQRATARNRSLQKKTLRYLLSSNAEPEIRHLMPVTRGRHRGRPHKSARALTRTFLSKGVVETGTDVPCVLMDNDGMLAPWGRKPSVSPSLSCKRKGAFLPSTTEHLSNKFGNCVRDASVGLASVSMDADKNNVGQMAVTNFSESALEGTSCDSHRKETVDIVCEWQSDYTLLGKLCSEDCGQPQLFAPDSIGGTVLKIMSLWLDVPEIQMTGLSALERLGAINGWSTVVALGGVPVLLSTMRHHTGAETLQLNGCILLGHIVASSADCRACLANLEGVAVVLAAMGAHSPCAPIQEASCRVLKELAACGKAAQECIVCLSGVVAVLKAMDIHIGNADVQIAACGVLRNMSAGKIQLQDTVASLGGVGKVQRALEHHGQCEAVQWAGIWSLFCLALQNQAVQAEIVSQGGICKVLQAMAMHLTTLRVQEAGCWVLKELAGMVKSDAMRSDCVQMVSTVLSMHNADEVRKVGRLALRKLLVPRSTPVNVGGISQPGRLGLPVEPSMIKRRRFPSSNDLAAILE